MCQKSCLFNRGYNIINKKLTVYIFSISKNTELGKFKFLTSGKSALTCITG